MSMAGSDEVNDNKIWSTDDMSEQEEEHWEESDNESTYGIWSEAEEDEKKKAQANAQERERNAHLG